LKEKKKKNLSDQVVCKSTQHIMFFYERIPHIVCWTMFKENIFMRFKS